MSAKIESINSKIATITAALRKLEAERDALTKFANLAVGGLVGFVFGRGDSKVNLQGEILGTGVQPNGVEVVSVLVGTGIDAEIKRIPKSTVNAYEAPASAHVPQEVVSDAGVAEAGTINGDALLA